MKILKALDLENVVFIDIETVGEVEKLEKGTLLYDSWVYKMKYNKEQIDKGEKTYEQLYEESSSLYAEFAKVVCITIGKIVKGKLKLKSYADKDEKVVLTKFCRDLTNIIASNKNTVLSGHSIKGFDIPFIMRRCMVNQVEPPSLIDVAALKPWEVSAIDIGELWKGSAFTGASLMNIAVALGLENPKEEMYPYETASIYYADPENGLKRIQKYCEDDVFTAANIVMRCRFEDILTRDEDATIDTKRVGVLERVYNTKNLDKASEQEIMEKLKNVPEEHTERAKEILDVVIPKTKKVK